MKLRLDLENVNINNLDYHQICRFCLSDEGILLPIFSSKDTYHQELPSQIKAILSTELEENDGLPSLICHSCLFNVERSYVFKHQCEKADSILRSQSLDNESKEETLTPQSCVASQTEPSQETEEVEQHTEVTCLEASENIDNSKEELDNDNTIDNALSEEENEDKNDNGEIEQEQEENVIENDTSPDVEDSNSVLQMEERFNDVEEGMFGSKPFSLDLCSLRLQSEGQDTIMFPPSQLTDEEQWSDSGTDLSDDLDGVETGYVTPLAGNCSNCNKAFSSPAELERHQHIHTQEPPYPCDYCDQEFEEKSLLKAHWRNHAGHKANMCLTCGEAYADRADLVKHFGVHDLIKPYHCNSCGKAFIYRSDLRKHAIVHTGARPFKCPVCYKTFTRSTNLNKHARVHTGRRPYQCKGCDKMFSSRGDLARHAVIHTGEKPYSCTICSLAFNRKDKLSRHERVHMTDRPFLCAECPTSFHRKEELTKHNRFHHFKPDPEFYVHSME